MSSIVVHAVLYVALEKTISGSNTCHAKLEGGARGPSAALCPARRRARPSPPAPSPVPQVEFSYPPLVPEEGHDSSSLPEEWKYLPFLALPDGAHNYQEDSVYFHLPPLTGDMKCVYGVSCYRQIEAKALRVRQADVTRETVQKSVCVLSRVPLYGLLQAKLQLITHAYFEEKDFSQISILKELYDHMNGSLRGTTPEGSQVYLGLSPRDLILHFRHKVLVLFKLVLLERKVLFYVSPVNRLVGTLMTVLSLFPGMMEHGLADSSHYRPRSSVSEESGQAEATPGSEEFVSVSVTDIDGSAGGCAARPERPAVAADGHLLKPPSRGSPESSESDWETLDPSVLEEGAPKSMEALDSEAGAAITEQPQSASGQAVLTQGLVSGLEEDQYGMPLAIFTKGYLCLPYMALQQHHLLSDVTVRGFVAGATNILFRQQRHLSDAVVDVEEGRIQIQDPELRRLMSLTTADLRFADYLVKHVTENREDVFLDGTGWEGGDEWIRAQFGLYVHSLLATSLQQDNEKLLADYGSSFVSAWKNTHNYRVWHSNRHPAMSEVTPGHPFQGQYSVADVKLKFSHSVQNSERGKKIGNAVMTTSRNVVQTGKAVGQSVGGALTSARSAMSSWFSTLAQPAGVTGVASGQPSAKP
ncbi:late secretory pathway protein AVL9 homolog isoform X1 [Scleropages formosus]|uniref:late secretory pathway protein AVL9 homolog isoform X1 n=1 Tax=Scleropages formosus TaxID=113540 RepID=UPI0010FA7659|nr:late secretory pathway protein AVL9 homolog isoform X1 [Scleropages formosus]